MAIIPLFVPHAACPHRCVFCNQRTISGEAETSLDEVQRQIDTWLPRIRPSRDNEAAFYGGSFTGLPLPLQERLLAPAEALLEQGVVGSIRLSTRPDYIDAPRLEFLQRHHVRLVELGVQSLDDAVLCRAERGHTAAQVRQAVDLLKAYGFRTGIQLMVGLPGQTFASVRETAETVCGLHPDVARIYPVLVLEGTALADQYRHGLYEPLTLDEAVEQAAWVYDRLENAGIRVIRTGLQPDAELVRPGQLLAGPFHPAMGELVKSRLYRQKGARLLAETGPLPPGSTVEFSDAVVPFLHLERTGQGVCIHFPPREESKLRGRHNGNLQAWQERFPGRIELVPEHKIRDWSADDKH